MHAILLTTQCTDHDSPSCLTAKLHRVTNYVLNLQLNCAAIKFRAHCNSCCVVEHIQCCCDNALGVVRDAHDRLCNLDSD